MKNYSEGDVKLVHQIGFAQDCKNRTLLPCYRAQSAEAADLEVKTAIGAHHGFQKLEQNINKSQFSLKLRKVGKINRT